MDSRPVSLRWVELGKEALLFTVTNGDFSLAFLAELYGAGPRVHQASALSCEHTPNPGQPTAFCLEFS